MLHHLHRSVARRAARQITSAAPKRNHLPKQNVSSAFLSSSSTSFASSSSSLSSSLAAKVPFSRHVALWSSQSVRTLSSAAGDGPTVAALNTAIAANDLKTAKSIVAKGQDVNSADYDGRTPLHVAASYNNVEMARWLVSEGAVLREDRDARLPIHDALQYGHTEMQQLFQTTKYIHNRDFSDTFDAGRVNTIFETVARRGLFTVDSVEKQLRYFVGDMGLGPKYHGMFSDMEIAEHFHSFMAASITASTSKKPENISFYTKSKDQIVYVFTDTNKLDVQEQAEKFMMDTPSGHGVTLHYVRSKQSALDTEGAKETLNVYRLQRSAFNTELEICDRTKNFKLVLSADPQVVGTKEFLATSDPKRLERVGDVLQKGLGQPSTSMTKHILDDGTLELNFAVPTGSVANDAVFLRSFSDTFFRLGHRSEGGGIEHFANGLSLYTFRTKKLGDSKTARTQDDLIEEIQSYANLAFTQFRSPLFEKYSHGKISGREMLYFHAACRYAFYFAYQKNDDLDHLYAHFQNDPVATDRVASLDKSLGINMYTLDELYECVLKNSDAACQLYIDFSRKMDGPWEDHTYPDIVEDVLASVGESTHRHMLETFYKFNQAVTSTNLWKTEKSATSFRFDPKIVLGDHNLPEIPYAIFMVLGLDFTGFHVRFRDISRGGVRLIQSEPDKYPENRKTQFLENFNLAYTQKLKNKDIPESGSKGTILMKDGKNDRSSLCFDQYVDAILDITQREQGVKNLHPDPEYLFLGPDENTADFMDNACLHAKKRNYEFWRSFTTGKSDTLGGIPHDTYGMTTLSVRSFVTGIMGKLGYKESECTKFITGGPDGDLGSNEISKGNEILVGISDGSGVLYDPNGIDQTEIRRLAALRDMVSVFDQSKLSDDGFFVNAKTDETLELPGGEVVHNGREFRDNFHLWHGLTADFFVPCGGRPESVHKGNVDKMLLKNGQPRFKYIVEGANLFITEPARNFLQEHGVMLFKDASTNKGGVTSSSMEVLAGLAMTDDEFAEHMQATESGHKPDFYGQYVEEVIKVVKRNATREFDYIYHEITENDKVSTMVTKELSEEMNKLNDMITDSDLYDDENLRRKVLALSIPRVLQDKVGGLDNILGRVPKAYLKAIFATYLSSSFVYDFKGTGSSYDFYRFMHAFHQK